MGAFSAAAFYGAIPWANQMTMIGNTICVGMHAMTGRLLNTCKGD